MREGETYFITLTKNIFSKIERKIIIKKVFDLLFSKEYLDFMTNKKYVNTNPKMVLKKKGRYIDIVG